MHHFCARASSSIPTEPQSSPPESDSLCAGKWSHCLLEPDIRISRHISRSANALTLCHMSTWSTRRAD